MTAFRRVEALAGWIVGLAAASSVLLTSSGPLLARLRGPAVGPDAAVGIAAAAAAWVVLGWLVLGVALTLLDVLTGAATTARSTALARLAATITPAAVRYAVHRSIRAGLVAGAVGTAVVTPTVAFADTPPAADVRLTDRPVPSGWPVLDRPARPVAAAVPIAAPPAGPVEAVATRAASGGHYRVRAGDSLWSIAARHLPTSASQAEVARAWPRWWRANRDVIGGDPALIRPGQVLRVPGSPT